MVVDDKATRRIILKEILDNWNMKPILVNSRYAALANLDQACNTKKPFYKVILDFQISDIDGFALAESIRENPRLVKVKVIILTSIGRRGDTTRFGELHVDD